MVNISSDIALIKPWCQLILEQMNPDFQFGSHQGNLFVIFYGEVI